MLYQGIVTAVALNQGSGTNDFVNFSLTDATIAFLESAAGGVDSNGGLVRRWASATAIRIDEATPRTGNVPVSYDFSTNALVEDTRAIPTIGTGIMFPTTPTPTLGDEFYATGATAHTGTWFTLPTSPTTGDTLMATNLLIPVFYVGSNQMPAPLYFVAGQFFAFYSESQIVGGLVPVHDGTNGVGSGLSAPRTETGFSTTPPTALLNSVGTAISVTGVGGDPNYYSASAAVPGTTHTLATATNINALAATQFLYTESYTGGLRWNGTIWDQVSIPAAGWHKYVDATVSWVSL